MTVKFGPIRKKLYYIVIFEQPSKQTGKMLRQVSSYVEDLAWFRARTERLGGRIIREDGPREVETSDVSI